LKPSESARSSISEGGGPTARFEATARDSLGSGRLPEGADSVSITRVQVWRGHDEIWAHSVLLGESLAAAGAQVSARWPAVRVWLDHHRDEHPWAVVVERDGQCVAAAVLSVRHRLGVGYVRSASEDGTSAAAVARTESAGLLLAEALSAELSVGFRPWVLRLGLLAEGDPVGWGLRVRLRHTQSVPAQQMPRLLFVPGSDLRRYLSRNTRSAVAKARNRLLDAGGGRLELLWLSAPERVQVVLGEVLDLHRRRNRQIRDHALLDNPAAAAYFQDMVLGHAEAGQLQLLTARVDGVLAAFAVCFVGGSTCWVYANLVAPEWTAFSVGTIANAEVVRRFHAEPGIDCLDWGAGVQRYKLSGDAVVLGTEMLQGWSSWPLRTGTQLRRLQPDGGYPLG
jgi:CelD/BcsL family acetyltransferase involved in cellulose biosynthesis